MEVNKKYIEMLLQLLNDDENLNIDEYKEEIIINQYLTLLSLSNIEFSEEIEEKEQNEITDFLRKMNNLKVKIQLKRKPEETNKLAEELITQYYENINILSTYIKDGIELENVINTMDAKSITNLIDKVTKDKMNKEYSKAERNKRRKELIELLPTNNYHIENEKIYIKNNDTYEEENLKDVIDMLNYLLNPDNYKIIYSNKTNQINHEKIITSIVKSIIVNEHKKEELDKFLIPMILTYILSLNIDNNLDIDTSNFNIENIKITELYSLAQNNTPTEEVNSKTPKWRNIAIPNEYLINKLKEMIKNGMYYYDNDSFVLEKVENKASDFKVRIRIEEIKEFIKTILNTKLEESKIKVK